jgi:hypothetical protein
MDDPAHGVSVADRARALEVMLSAEDPSRPCTSESGYGSW